MRYNFSYYLLNFLLKQFFYTKVIKGGIKLGNEIKLFEGNKIRSVWDNEKEEWYFSVVDIVGALTESKNPRRYWSDLKRKMKDEEGAIQLYEKIVQLKLESSDGKMYNTDVADIQGIFRIIQSIPSPKAEPFKMWLSEVGKETGQPLIAPKNVIDLGQLIDDVTKEVSSKKLKIIRKKNKLFNTFLKLFFHKNINRIRRENGK